MRMSVLRKTEYDGYTVYVMQFGFIFQYLFADKKGRNIYQDHIEMKPRLVDRLKYKFGITDSPYSEEDLEASEQIVLSGAIKTIDALKNID